VSLSEWRRWHLGRCQACGTVLTGAESRECPTLCNDCCDRIDPDYEAQRDQEWTS